MPAVALPRLIEEKFEDLALQVRRLWLYRGISRVVVVAILAAALAMIVDRTFSLGPGLRWPLTLAWVLLMTLAIWRFAVRPQFRRLSVEELAVAIESQFPSLSERLMTLVELSQSRDAGHGSKPLIDLLVRDTAQRTKRLNFERAAPTGSAIRVAMLAGGLVGIAVMTLLFAGGGGERLKRFLLPWHTPKNDLPFAIKVSSGSVVVKRGESVTLTAYLERLRPDAVLPAVATLIAKNTVTHVEKKFAMTGDDHASFHMTWPAAAEAFDYRVESGGAISDWFGVTVMDPVDLTAGTSVTITPPEYAVPPLQKATLPGFAAVSGLQHSQVQFNFVFGRPATSATLDWLASGPATVEGVRQHLALSADRRSATGTVSLTASGTYRLTVTGEQGVVTSISGPANAIVDQPPKFEKAVGISERVREVRPDESFILEVAVMDDFKVESLALEYAINGGSAKEIPIPLRDLGTPRAEGKHVFSLQGLAKEGETLTYRLRATDNRRVALAALKPQVTHFPEKGWGTLRIASGAASLDQQDILAERDAIRKNLDEASKLAEEARQEAEKVLRELGDKPMLTAEQVARRQAARDAAAKAAALLDAAAKEAALTPELRQLAESMRAAANETLRAADDLLRRSENEPNAANRNAAIADARKQLTAARDRFDALRKANDDLARNRLDKRRLERLAAEVNRLAAEAKQATSPQQLDEILQKLQRAKDELRDVVNGNPSLRQGSESAASQQARELAAEAGKLQGAQQALTEEISKHEATGRKAALADAAAKQAGINAKAEALRDRAAKAGGEEPLAKAPFDDAAKKLREGDSVAAMTEQEKASRDLERVAESLEKAAGERRDSRLAAKQLAKLQDDLRQQMEDAAKKPLTDAEKARFAAQQEAIRKATEKLSTPAADASSTKAKANALVILKAADETVASNPAGAGDAQQEAAAALKELAEVLPAREAWLKQAKADLDRLQREQGELQREIDDKLKPFERKKPDASVQEELGKNLAEQMKKQAVLAEKLAKLDAPGYEERRDRVAQAAGRAGDDLRDGRPLDIPASQGELNRQIARLRSALDGGTPSDAAAEELARQQQQIAERLQNATPDSATLAELQRLQRDVADKLGNLNDPDGGDRLARARQSTQNAARQFQNANQLDELRAKAKQAAMDLNELTDHLAGVPTDRERIERLAKQRRERAEWSAANAFKPTPAEQAAAMQNELEQDLTDLRQTRVGTAQEAKKDAVEALEKLKKTPRAERAPAVQKAAADAIAELATKMQGDKQNPGKRSGREGDASGDAGGQLPSRADAESARELARQQREIRDRTAKAAEGVKPDAKQTEQQVKKQKDLAEKAEKLAKGMEAASHAPTNNGGTANDLTQGAEAANKAREAMEKAAREQKAGHAASAAEARAEAAKALEQAQAKAKSAAGPASAVPDPKAVAASRLAEEANKSLRDAGQTPGKAAPSLKKAAEKIGEAADRLGEVGKAPNAGGTPGGNDGAPSKPLAPQDLPPDLQQYAGKPWGELPGDVKARIIQDLKAKYGEDYARVIKLYFEQLAEKK